MEQMERMILVLLVAAFIAICQGQLRSPIDDFNANLKRLAYSTSSPPHDDRATDVKIGIYVNSFSSVSEADMDYTISFYLRQSWKDPRLAFDPDDIGGQTDRERRGRITQIRLDDETIKTIWRPDTFFRNEKSAAFHDVTMENKLMTVNMDGSVWYVIRLTATLSCPMDLKKYPHDKQRCPLMFESFGYTTDMMYFSWMPRPVDVDHAMRLPQFKLRRDEKILYDCSQNYTGGPLSHIPRTQKNLIGVQRVGSGVYPCLEIRFVLERKIAHYIMQFYVPTILIVMLSWFSFWIDVNRVDARFTYGVVNVLIMTTCMWASDHVTLSRAAHVKAIDVWTMTCLLFLFAALLESAIISFIAKKRQAARRGDSEKIEASEDRVSGMVDTVSRIAFPVCFAIFSIIYFAIYA